MPNPNIQISRYRHVIWDWNGTLIDDACLCVEIVNSMLARRHKAPITREMYAELFGFPVLDYYRKIGLDSESEPFETVGYEFVEEYERRKMECVLHPAARQVLEAIRKGGITQSVLSAYRQERLEELVGKLGLRDYFSGLFGHIDDYAAGKVEKGRQLMRELGCAPGQVVLIGDTVHDFEVACAMGSDCILIHSGHNALWRLRECRVPVLNILDDLLEAIRMDGKEDSQ